LVKMKYLKSVSFTAPTHKAVNVMKAKFKTEAKISEKQTLYEYLDKMESKGINILFMTIHKLLDFGSDIDLEGNKIFVQGNKIFVQGKQNQLTNFDLILIDETSMLSFELILTLFQTLYDEKKKKSSYIPKIMFVGDPAQLPPVKESRSVIFSKSIAHFNPDVLKQLVEFPPDKFNNVVKNIWDDIKKQKSCTMKEIVRTQQSKLIALCNHIRVWVLGDDVPLNVHKYKGEGVCLFKYNSKKKEDKTKTKWLQKFIKYQKELGEVTTSNYIILTWTNKQTDEYNRVIRETIFKKKKLKKIERGDILMLKDFYELEETTQEETKTDKGVRFYTSEQVRVTEYEETVKGCLSFVMNQRKCVDRIKNNKFILSKLSKYITKLNKMYSKKYKVWKLYVHKVADAQVKNTVPEVYTLYVLKDEEIPRLEKEKKNIAFAISELRDSFKKMFKDQSSSIDRFIIKDLWIRWYEIFIKPFASVNYGYSTTVHKRQGSTNGKVFIDLDDIFKNFKVEDTKRCIYTALTRASLEVNLLI